MRSQERATMVGTLLATVIATACIAGCGEKGPSCEQVGQRLGELELAERWGHVAQFMTDDERAAKAR